MKTSMWNLVLWIIGFLANVGLFYALVVKSRIAKFPIFSLLVALQIVRTVSLFAVRSLAGRIAYFDMYWLFAALDYLFQLGLIAEIGRAIFSPSVGVVAQARTRILLWCGLSVLPAAMVAFSIPVPPAEMNPVWDTQVSLFTSLLTCQCYVIVSGAINRLKVQNKGHLIGIGNGFVLWAAMETARDGIYAATRWHYNFRFLDELHMIVYVCVTIYWTGVLWREEPKREALSVEKDQFANAQPLSPYLRPNATTSKKQAS